MEYTLTLALTTLHLPYYSVLSSLSLWPDLAALHGQSFQLGTPG
jgi:hypothetical protein